MGSSAREYEGGYDTSRFSLADSRRLRQRDDVCRRKLVEASIGDEQPPSEIDHVFPRSP